MTEEMKQVQEQKIKQIKIRPYDILDIRVSTPSEDMNKLFNQITDQSNQVRGNNQSGYRTGY